MIETIKKINDWVRSEEPIFEIKVFSFGSIKRFEVC